MVWPTDKSGLQSAIPWPQHRTIGCLSADQATVRPLLSDASGHPPPPLVTKVACCTAGPVRGSKAAFAASATLRHLQPNSIQQAGVSSSWLVQGCSALPQGAGTGLAAAALGRH